MYLILSDPFSLVVDVDCTYVYHFLLHTHTYVRMPTIRMNYDIITIDHGCLIRLLSRVKSDLNDIRTRDETCTRTYIHEV